MGLRSHFFLLINNSMKSPCKKICRLGTYISLGSELICIGCRRTFDEIKDWTSYTDEKRDTIMKRLQ